MHYNYYFDICAMCILVTIALTSLSRRWVPSYRQRAYLMLFFTTFMAAFSERVETHLQMFPIDVPWYHLAEMVCGSVYFICHLGSGFFYLKYILSVLDIYVDYRKLSDYLMVILDFTIGIILVVINFFYPILFYYDESGIYHRESFIFLYYILAGYYIFFGLIMMHRYKKLMRLRTKMVVFSYVILVLAGLITQYFLPTVLIENFFSTISITLVYISLQNPSEMIDENLNILNRKAFLEGLDIKTDRKSSHTTIFVTIDNIRALSDEIGYTQAEGVLKKISAYLKSAGRNDFRLQTYTYRYSENVFAVTVHTSDKALARSLMETIAKRLHEPFKFGTMAIRAEGHCFLLTYPDDYKTVSELMNKLEHIFDRLDDEREVIVDTQKDIFSQSQKLKDYDNITRNSMENKTAVIKFQPMLSKVYRINYTADVLFFPKDEFGSEIDVRGHVPDIAVTQALLDADEFTYRNACKALTFWNAGDKNGKYRAIVGLSQGEISRSDFVRRIKKILREERAEASWITLKLTETTITTMNATAERNLKYLGEMKCSIIVDKFGSGYGDLDKILALPVTQVNIDHSILAQAVTSDRMKIAAQGIINLFHDISIFVGAADIESEEEKKMAEELGCDFMIGDYMGPPVKDSSFVKYINSYFEEG